MSYLVLFGSLKTEPDSAQASPLSGGSSVSNEILLHLAFLLHQMGLTRELRDIIAVYRRPQHLRWKVSELGKACPRQVNTLISGAQGRKIHPMSSENYPAGQEKQGFTLQRTRGDFLFLQSLNFTSGLRLEEVLKSKGKSYSLEP